MINLADSSELGWRVVQEDVMNLVTYDSEDEKQMHRAQTKADRRSDAEQ